MGGGGGSVIKKKIVFDMHTKSPLFIQYKKIPNLSVDSHSNKHISRTIFRILFVYESADL